MQKEPERAKPQGLGEFLFNELRQGIQDIRQKVVEEGWFGRVVTAKPVVELQRDAPGSDSPAQHDGLSVKPGERELTFDEMWSPTERSREREAEPLEHER